MADDSVTKSSVSGDQAATRACSSAPRETCMSGDSAGLISFFAAAELLGERWDASKREICGWVMDGRLVPYSVEGSPIFVGGIFERWALEFATAQETKETGVATDYLPAIERCHFVKNDVDEFDPAVLSAKVIELNQTMARRRADEEGNPRPLNIPTYRYVDGQWLLERLHRAVSDPLDYLGGLIEDGRFECAFHPVLDEGGFATWLFDRESAERILREDFPQLVGVSVGSLRMAETAVNSPNELVRLGGGKNTFADNHRNAIDKHISNILNTAKRLDVDIKMTPRGKKKEIEKASGLTFDQFKKAWQEARNRGLVDVENVEKYRPVPK